MMPGYPSQSIFAGRNHKMKRTWYVLYVKPRTEKKVVEWMKFYRFFYHLPLYLKIRKVQRRKVRVYLPLFPGYVFTRLNPDERLTILKTNLIISTIQVDKPRKMIHQLRQIKNATRNGPVVKVHHSFKEGDLVKITSGAFRGVEGVVKREGAKATLCLNCEILGASVEVAVSPADVEKVESQT